MLRLDQVSIMDNNKESLFYTGLGPVESVSQMLLSTGAKLGLGQD